MTAVPRVTFLVLPRLVGGGAERQVRLLHDHLCANGHAVTVVVTEPETAAAFGAEVDWFAHADVRRLTGPARVAALLAVLDERPATLLVLINDRIAYRALGAVRARRPELRIVELVYGLDERPATLMRSASMVDATVVESEPVARPLRCIGRTVTVAPNGVDVDAFDPLRLSAVARGAIGLPRSAATIGFLGRLDPVKGADVLLAAMSHADWQDLDASVVIAGDGPQRGALERARRSLPSRLRRAVTMVGQIADAPGFLAACDVVVVPSRRDGRPNVVLEAMAAGRAVVASRVGDIEAMLDGGRCGVLVPPSDAGALAGAIGGLLRDRAAMAGFGRAARERLVAEWPLARTLPALAAAVTGGH